jgi:hypothetical protein
MQIIRGLEHDLTRNFEILGILATKLTWRLIQAMSRQLPLQIVQHLITVEHLRHA